jgi:hypothetical protein
MKPWRKVIEKERQPGNWILRLECGHAAYRSAQYSFPELPGRVLCEGCQSLIGSQVKNPLGKLGTVASYNNGLFDIAWKNNGLTRCTLDELREKTEIL